MQLFQERLQQLREALIAALWRVASIHRAPASTRRTVRVIRCSDCAWFENTARHRPVTAICSKGGLATIATKGASEATKCWARRHSVLKLRHQKQESAG